MAAIHGRFTRSQILIQNGTNHSDACALALALAADVIEFPSDFHQVGRSIVWTSMAILLSTLLLSTATSC